ncbi:MAG: rod shape-determining protein MreC [Bacteroidota bacterium]
MRNLIVFILRNHFFLLFLFFEIIAIQLMVKYNEPQRSQFEIFSHTFFSHIHSVHNSVTQYFNLKQINEDLALENATLRKKLPSSHFSESIEPQTVKDSLHSQQYLFIPAQVINNTISKPHNFIIINKGRRHGIQKNMGVIGPNGIIGVVVATSQNFSKILSLLSPNLNISAQLQHSNFYGSVHWDGANYRQALFTEIPAHAYVSEGDTVVSNTYSNMYPSGIPIGVVSSVSKTKYDNFYDIKIILSTDFKNIEHVYVVQDLYKSERELLESRQQ